MQIVIALVPQDQYTVSPFLVWTVEMLLYDNPDTQNQAMSPREDGEQYIVLISDHYSSLDGLRSVCRSVMVPSLPARFTGLNLREVIGALQHLTAL